MEESAELVMAIDTEAEEDELEEDSPAPPATPALPPQRQQSILLSLIGSNRERSITAPGGPGIHELYRTRRLAVCESEAETAHREKLQRMYIKRRQIINEILHTEKIYVNNLEVVITVRDLLFVV